MAVNISVLKTLIIEYQTNPSELIAGRILFRIDPLLIYIVKFIWRRNPQLDIIGSQGLYHSAVIGALSGIDKVQMSDSETDVLKKITNGVAREITRSYRSYKRKLILWGKEPRQEDVIQLLRYSPNNLFSREDMIEFVEVVQNLVRVDAIPLRNVLLLLDKYVNKMTNKELEVKYSRTTPILWITIKRTLALIKGRVVK